MKKIFTKMRLRRNTVNEVSCIDLYAILKACLHNQMYVPSSSNNSLAAIHPDDVFRVSLRVYIFTYLAYRYFWNPTNVSLIANGDPNSAAASLIVLYLSSTRLRILIGASSCTPSSIYFSKMKSINSTCL